MCPVYVPGASPELLAETVRFEGVLPVCGETVAKVAVLETLKLVVEVADTASVCEGVSGPLS